MSDAALIQPKVTLAIPLYKSAEFIETIIENIDVVSLSDVEILISDRHYLDDTIDRLSERYRDDSRVRCLKHQDQLDWVGHLNAMLKEARGEYWRFIPHDDIFPAGSLESLIAALDSNPDAILAYGPTLGIDYDGNSLPKHDRSDQHPAKADENWDLGLILEMFWCRYFQGAFKGLIRRKLVIENQVFIRSTRDQIAPERCWLFALCLLGRFCFIPESIYIKRFYDGSTHTQREICRQTIFSVAHVMSEYLHDILGSGPAYQYGAQDIWLNANRKGRWIDNPIGKRPEYLPAPSPDSETIRKLKLPQHSDG